MYTARAPAPSRLLRGREFRITVGSKRRMTAEGFGDLYERITAIAHARAAMPAEDPYVRLIEHGWYAIGETRTIAAAFVTVGVAEGGAAEHLPPGRALPTQDELREPGGASLADLSEFRPQDADEVFNEFDFPDRSGDRQPFLLSYGERATITDGMDPEPFERRAESLSVFYGQFIAQCCDPLRVISRNSYFISDPGLVTVEIRLA